MFSVQQKRDISDAVQKILRATNHAELPATGEISFLLHIDGAESWSWADIRNNGAVGDPGVNPHNELMASKTEEQGRTIIEEATALAGDPRATPDDHLREIVENKWLDLETRLRRLEQRDTIKDKLYSETNSRLERLEDFLKEIMEDDVIRHYGDQIANLSTAIRQLGNSEINKTLKGD